MEIGVFPREDGGSRDARLCLVGERPLSNDMTCNRDTVTINGTDALRLGTPVRPYIIVTRHECPLCQSDTCNPLRCHVGTHGLCVRCVKGYSVVVLTGTDALRLDTLVRPYFKFAE